MSAARDARRVLAVDFGDRRTGLAATDWTGTIEVPLHALVGLADDDCAAAIAALAVERETERIVVGLPVSRDGGEGPRAKRTREFIARLASRTTCPIDVVDESWSTDEAHARLKELGIKAAQRKKVADCVAALVILQRYRHGM